MSIQPVRSITQFPFQQRNPHPQTKCEACGRHGQAVEVAGESRVLCPSCTGYMERVKVALPKKKPSLTSKMLEAFERMGQRLGAVIDRWMTKALEKFEGMDRYEPACWAIIMLSVVVILGQGIRWWLM